MGAGGGETWGTDFFLHVEADDWVYFRLRPAPPQEDMPMYFSVLTGGTQNVGIYDLVKYAWGEDVEFDGVVIFDYASYDDIHAIELLPMMRSKVGPVLERKGIRLPIFWIEPGCVDVPRPWHGTFLSVEFQFYNPDENDYQTLRVDGGPLRLVTASPIGGETVITYSTDEASAYVEVCTGEDPDLGGSHAGWGPDLGLWVLPRFKQFEDFVVTTVW